MPAKKSPTSSETKASRSSPRFVLCLPTVLASDLLINFYRKKRAVNISPTPVAASLFLDLEAADGEDVKP